MATLREKIFFAARQLTLYEIAGILMFGMLSIIFFGDAQRLHDVLRVGQAPYLFLDNLAALFQFPLSYVFSGILFLIICVYFALRHSKNSLMIRTRNLIRMLASFCLMMAVYKIITFYIHVFHPILRDTTLQHIDRMIFFGKLPSEWIAPFAAPVLTYIFFAAYMSWFTMIYITLWLMWKHSSKAAEEYVTATILAFYIGYLAYAVVPAVGPVFTIHYSTALGPIMNLLTMGQTALPCDCFPSLHTGISIIMLIFIRRYYKKLFKAYLLLTTMIILSTQYLRVHYGIDIIAGVALGICICQIAPLWVKSSAEAKLKHRTKPSVGVPAAHSADSLSELA